MSERILIVDDEAHNLEILRIFLNSLHYEVHEAVCGEDALRMIDLVSPDLILLDNMMPDISGLTICRELNQRDDFQTPIIFLSAKVQKEDILLGLQSGAIDYLTKPFDLDLLERKVSMALENNKKMKKLQIDNENLTMMAFKDGLTGLYNRFYLNEVNWRITEGVETYHSVMMIDIDNFKQINDIYGHIWGDHVIETVSKIIKDNIDLNKDIAFRYAGDEFLILLGEGSERSLKLVKNIHKTVSELVFPLEANREFQATLSIGFTPITYNQSLKNSIARADAALFEAKNKGRNQVSIW
ncbi:MAG TPA: diguanylate cyclase [Bacilli bacterium]